MKVQNNYPNLDLELDLFNKGYKYIIGIDEAGRGAWAGPMAIGGYLIIKDMINYIPEVKDSKLLSEVKREKLFDKIKKDPFSVLLYSNTDIDRKGLTSVFKEGIEELIVSIINKYLSNIKNIDKSKIKILVDGNYKFDLDYDIDSIIDGDYKHYSISAASITAKVTRDNIMKSLSKSFPEYGFDKNKGYGTKKHIQALQNYGSSLFHRLSYKPIIDINKSNRTTKIFN